MESPNLIGGMNLNAEGQKKRDKYLIKLSKLETKLKSVVDYHQANPSYVAKRDNDSVTSFQQRLEALDLEEEAAVLEFRKQYQARRDNIQKRLEEAKQRQAAHLACKPKDIHTAETAVISVLEEMNMLGLANKTEFIRLKQLKGEITITEPLPEVAPSPPEVPPPPFYSSSDHRAPLPPLRVRTAEEKKAEDNMPLTHEELELKRMRANARRADTRERKAEVHRELQEFENKRQKEVEENWDYEYAVEQFKRNKPTEPEPEKPRVVEEEDHSDAESSITETTPEEEEAYRLKMLERYKKPAFYTPPPPPVQEFPRILSNTKSKKQPKTASKH